MYIYVYIIYFFPRSLLRREDGVHLSSFCLLSCPSLSPSKREKSRTKERKNEIENKPKQKNSKRESLVARIRGRRETERDHLFSKTKQRINHQLLISRWSTLFDRPEWERLITPTEGEVFDFKSSNSFVFVQSQVDAYIFTLHRSQWLLCEPEQS